MFTEMNFHFSQPKSIYFRKRIYTALDFYCIYVLWVAKTQHTFFLYKQHFAAYTFLLRPPLDSSHL